MSVKKRKPKQGIQSRQAKDRELLASKRSNPISLQEVVTDLKQGIKRMEGSHLVEELESVREMVSSELREEIDEALTEQKEGIQRLEHLAEDFEIYVLNEGEAQLVTPGLSLEERVSELPSTVRFLYEQTRDGMPTTDKQRKQILMDTEIKGDDVYNAIRLGIKSWSFPLLQSKER